jgi:hypothetical protein
MGKKKETVRHYKVSDATLKQTGDNLLGSARRDITEMSTRGADATYLDNFETELNDFGDIATDEELVGAIGIATEAKDAARDVLDTFMATIRTMAENKWGQVSSKFRSYSFGQMSQLNDDQLWRLSKRVLHVATEQLADLASEGLTQPYLDDMEAASDAFDAAIDAKANAEKNRDNATEDRILAGNAVYLKMQRISRIGKDIWYETSEAKYNDYVMDHIMGGSNSPAPNVSISGILRDSVTNLPIQGASVVVGSKSDTTDAGGAFQIQFYISQPTVYNVSITKAGYEPLSTTVQFAPDVDVVQDTELSPVNTVVGNVTGVVTDSNTALPLGGAFVQSDTGGIQVVTAANGSYTLTDIPAGARTISYSKMGYVSQQIQVNVTEGGTATQNVALMPE